MKISKNWFLYICIPFFAVKLIDLSIAGLSFFYENQSLSQATIEYLILTVPNVLVIWITLSHIFTNKQIEKNHVKNTLR